MKQIIKTKDCMDCDDRCCRFDPDMLSYSPIFTGEEYEKVLSKGFNSGNFKKLKGNVYKVKMKEKEGKFLLCPFVKDLNKCAIYDVEPFYCKIWPFNVMRSKDGKKIHLVIDVSENCPVINKIRFDDMNKYTKYLMKLLQSEKYLEFFNKYPKMIKEYDTEYSVLYDLEALSCNVGENN